jgi:short-subunit dehydrogenase
MKNLQTVLITGASSGLGWALALGYAEPGRTLFVSGRDQKRLQELSLAIEKKGARAETQVIDVVDAAAMKAWVESSFRNAGGIDLLIANAGISGGTKGTMGVESASQARAIFETNVIGKLNTVLPVIPLMIERGRGQIGLMASLAGFRGLPTTPSYSASKGAVRLYAEGLRGNLQKHGIKVSAICPGYIRTPLTAANSYYMPGLMSAEKAAQKIMVGLESNKARIAFPCGMFSLVWLLSVLPPSWTDWFMAKLPSKQALEMDKV